MKPRHILVALLVLASSAPAAFVVTGANTAVADDVWRRWALPAFLGLWEHPHVLVGAAMAGVSLALSGLLGVALSRPSDVPGRGGVGVDEILLDADATNPRGVRVPVFTPNGGHR